MSLSPLATLPEPSLTNRLYGTLSPGLKIPLSLNIKPSKPFGASRPATPLSVKSSGDCERFNTLKSPCLPYAYIAFGASPSFPFNSADLKKPYPFLAIVFPKTSLFLDTSSNFTFLYLLALERCFV